MAFQSNGKQCLLEDTGQPAKELVPLILTRATNFGK